MPDAHTNGHAPAERVVAEGDLERLLREPAFRQEWERLQEERRAVRTEALHVRAAKRSLAQKRQTVTGGDQQKQSIWAGSDERARKNALYDLYVQSTVLGSVIDVIARRFVSGVWSIAPPKGQGDSGAQQKQGAPAARLALADFFGYCNANEDFNQILYKSVIDLCVFGETFWEVVPRAGVPYALYSLPAPKMDTLWDSYGDITGYTIGSADAPGMPKALDPQWIIRTWVPSPKDPMKAFAIAEGAVNPLYTDQQMVRSQQKTFENMGSQAQVVHNLPESYGRDQALDYQNYLEEMHSGVLNTARELVTYGGATVQALQLRGPDAPFLAGRDEARYEVYGRTGVPGSMVGHESAGHLGGAGVSESQERNFVQNVLHFYRHILLEKLNFRVVGEMFGVEGWVVQLDFADVLGDAVAPLMVTQNEKRAQQGLPPLDPQRGGWTLFEIQNHVHGEQDAEPGQPADGQEQPGAPGAPGPAAKGTAGKGKAVSKGAGSASAAGGSEKPQGGQRGQSGQGAAESVAGPSAAASAPQRRRNLRTRADSAAVERTRRAYEEWSTEHDDGFWDNLPDPYPFGAHP
jgi:hypothetical protein